MRSSFIGRSVGSRLMSRSSRSVRRSEIELPPDLACNKEKRTREPLYEVLAHLEKRRRGGAPTLGRREGTGRPVRYPVRFTANRGRSRACARRRSDERDNERTSSS